MRALLSLSRPRDMSSEEEENADRSKWAPMEARAPPDSFGHPGNLNIIIVKGFFLTRDKKIKFVSYTG